MRSEKRIYEKSLLIELVKDKHSCLSLKSCTRKIELQPKYLKKVKVGIKEALDQCLNKYDYRLNGILLDYQNLSFMVDENSGKIVGKSGEFVVSIQGEFFVFQPEIGNLLKGVVNVKSDSHVGCLVHKRFNAMILKPEDVELETWNCRNVQIGDEIVFEIADHVFTGHVPFIEGQISGRYLEKKLRKTLKKSRRATSSVEHLQHNGHCSIGNETLKNDEKVVDKIDEKNLFNLTPGNKTDEEVEKSSIISPKKKKSKLKEEEKIDTSLDDQGTKKKKRKKDKDKVKDKDEDSVKEKEGVQDKEKEKIEDKDKDENGVKEKEKIKHKKKDKHREREKEKVKDKHEDKNEVKEKENIKNEDKIKDGMKDKVKKKEQYKEKEKTKNKDKSGIKEKENFKDKDRVQKKETEIQIQMQKEIENETENDEDKAKEKEIEKNEDEVKEKEIEKNEDEVKEKEIEKNEDKDGDGDEDRVKEKENNEEKSKGKEEVNVKKKPEKSKSFITKKDEIELYSLERSQTKNKEECKIGSEIQSLFDNLMKSELYSSITPMDIDDKINEKQIDSKPIKKEAATPVASVWKKVEKPKKPPAKKPRYETDDGLKQRLIHDMLQSKQTKAEDNFDKPITTSTPKTDGNIFQNTNNETSMISTPKPLDTLMSKDRKRKRSSKSNSKSEKNSHKSENEEEERKSMINALLDSVKLSLGMNDSMEGKGNTSKTKKDVDDPILQWLRSSVDKSTHQVQKSPKGDTGRLSSADSGFNSLADRFKI